MRVKKSHLFSLALTSFFIVVGCGAPADSEVTPDEDVAEVPADETNTSTETANNDETSDPFAEISSIVASQNLPSDSTGKDVELVLGFQSQTNTSSGLSLVETTTEEESTTEVTASTEEASTTEEAAPASIELAGGITITDARFSIASIKIKPSKDASEEEKQLEAEEQKEEAELEAEVEGEIAEAEAASDDDMESEGEEETASDESDDDSSESAEEDEGALLLAGNPNGDAGAASANQSQTPPEKKDNKKMKEKRAKYLKAKKDVLKERQAKALEKMKQRDNGVQKLGPYVFDAVTNTMTPEMDAMTLKDGTYRRIQFQLKRNWSVSEEDGLFSNVFHIAGTHTKEEVATNFVVDYHIATNIRIAGESGAELTEDKNELAVVFDLDKWFAGIDLGSAEKDEDGVVYINKNSNKEILRAIHKNIRNAFIFGKDKDNDGKISADESDAEAQDEEAAEETEEESEEEAAEEETE